MRKSYLTAAFAVVMALPFCVAAASETDDLIIIVEEETEFETESEVQDLNSAALVDFLYEQENSNVVISDMSINMALSMILEGAGGETKNQLEEYLGADLETNRTKNEEILAALSELDGTTLELANSLWYDSSLADNELAINEDYITVLEDSYGAAVEEADFSDAGTADLINDWCSENTEGLIDQIVTPDSIAGQSAILANALYFLGTWTDPFPDAVEDTFYGFDSDYTVDMMSGTVSAYYENDYATAFAKYYMDGYFFVGILPKDEGDFNLADLDINGLLATLATEYDVEVKLPKFAVEYSTMLNEALESCGVTDLFRMDADLSGLSDGMYVSNILHKTYISVDEVGTEAAAVTSIGIKMTMALPDEPEIKEVYLDRPFAFAILDSDGNILFLGKITEV